MLRLRGSFWSAGAWKSSVRKMDGFEAARQIRRVPHKDAQMIPIIAMSAKDAREDMDACKEAGMNDYLAKPVEPQRLYQVLAEYLENPM